jgi:hypothetical protein
VKKLIIITACYLILFMLQGCFPTEMVRIQSDIDSVPKEIKGNFMKVYLNDGGLYVLDDWLIDDQVRLLMGTGKFYNMQRKGGSSGEDVSQQYSISFDDITLVETNKLRFHAGNLAAISIVGVPLALTAFYCITDPKACFGSCPTFYAFHDDDWQLVAEGFSSSILPVFEKKDVDMLYWTKNKDRNFSLKLTNEALETHAIRYAGIIAFPKEEGKRVFATAQGEFRRMENLLSPGECIAPEGNCIADVKEMDHRERFSKAGSQNLAEKEEVVFSFNNPGGKNPGLLISTRQTLLTTYLFYQGLAYTGNYTGYYMSSIENGNNRMKKQVERLWDKLGGIEIYMKTAEGKWQLVEVVEEMGPIAADVHLVKLPVNAPANVTLKLKMTRGLWRIDYLALGEICEEATPVVLNPEAVWNKGMQDEESLQLLNDTTKYLVTFPGDQYRLDYTLPDDRDYEIFLNTKGYYLEWMRDEWLAEQDLVKAKLMLAFPGLFMRKVARAFKNSESQMEDIFWGSRYVQN